MTIKLNPYINLNGDAQQALKLYERALGAQVENLMRWSEMPEQHWPDGDKERIMHCTLRIGDQMLMVSDVPSDVKVGPGNTQVCLHFENVTDMQKSFDILAEGGAVTMPIHDAFWGNKFGMLTDKFGARWMFICPQTTKG